MDKFESEWKKYCASKGGGAVTMNVKDIAKHFFELGLRVNNEKEK